MSQTLWIQILLLLLVSFLAVVHERDGRFSFVPVKPEAGPTPHAPGFPATSTIFASNGTVLLLSQPELTSRTVVMGSWDLLLQIQSWGCPDHCVAFPILPGQAVIVHTPVWHSVQALGFPALGRGGQDTSELQPLRGTNAYKQLSR